MWGSDSRHARNQRQAPTSAALGYSRIPAECPARPLTVADEPLRFSGACAASAMDSCEFLVVRQASASNRPRDVGKLPNDAWEFSLTPTYPPSAIVVGHDHPCWRLQCP